MNYRRQRNSRLSLHSRTPPPPLQIHSRTLSTRTAAERSHEWVKDWRHATAATRAGRHATASISHLGRPVKKTRASTFQKELLVVGDAALGESPRVLDPGERRNTWWWLIDGWWTHGSICCVMWHAVWWQSLLMRVSRVSANVRACMVDSPTPWHLRDASLEVCSSYSLFLDPIYYIYWLSPE